MCNKPVSLFPCALHVRTRSHVINRISVLFKRRGLGNLHASLFSGPVLDPRLQGVILQVLLLTSWWRKRSISVWYSFFLSFLSLLLVMEEGEGEHVWKTPEEHGRTEGRTRDIKEGCE